MNLFIIKRDINSDVLITELFFYKIMPLIYIYVKRYKIYDTKFKIKDSRNETRKDKIEFRRNTKTRLHRSSIYSK